MQDLVDALAPLVRWEGWYLDDAHLVGSPGQLDAAVREVQKRGAELGLNLNLTKCRLWGPATGALVTAVATDSPLLRIPTLAFTPDSGIKALGVPVVHPGNMVANAAARAVWAQRVGEVQRLCNALLNLPEPHVKFTLLRTCLDACKVNDLLRATPLIQAQAENERLSRVIRDAFEAIVGFPVTEDQWTQITLPTRYGGLGVSDPVHQRLQARIGMGIDFITRVQRLLLLPEEVIGLPPDLPLAFARGAALLGPTHLVAQWHANPSLAQHGDDAQRRQRWWADEFHASRQQALSRTLQGEAAIRFASQSQPHAMAWTAVIPSGPLHTLIPGVDFRMLLAWHLGQPQAPTSQTACPKCGVTQDVTGHHLVCCTKNRLMQRHGAVQDFLLRLAHKAGYVARKEQTGLDRTRPGDIFVSRYSGGQPAAVDLTVRHTLRVAQPVRRPDGLGEWQERQEQEKDRRYRSQCDRLGWVFIPFVADCYGGLAARAREFMSACIKLITAQVHPGLARNAEADAWQGLTLTIAKEVAAQLRTQVWATAIQEDTAQGGGSGQMSARWAHCPYGELPRLQT